MRAAGSSFLTDAFRAAGALSPDNAVTAITSLEKFDGGSTGQKAMLSVAYERPSPDLPEQLFVKFSRDFDDPLRDRGKRQMASEVRFALMSQDPGFPVAVPRCMFGEYHSESGSGILITERIAFGIDEIEPHYAKARDYEVPDLLGHYEALVTALARLAGSGIAFDTPASTPKTKRSAYTPEDARARVDAYADFAARFPSLLPASITSAIFLDQLREVAPRSIEHADAVRRAMGDPLHAFCHWNANIDNAWFWRDDDGTLTCGLLDWGNVGQIDVVRALSSCLTFAEPEFVVEHLDHLLARFATEFEAAGGVPLDPALLRSRFALQMVVGGLQWPLGAVGLLERHLPPADACITRLDPFIADNEHLRTQLHLLTWSLVLWKASNPQGVIDQAIRSLA